jgi:hypothetical protein
MTFDSVISPSSLWAVSFFARTFLPMLPNAPKAAVAPENFLIFYRQNP